MSNSEKNIEVPEEFDIVERKVTFYLYMKPIELGRNNKERKINTKMKHWALVAEFEDESYRTMEAYNEQNKLSPSYKKLLPANEGKRYKPLTKNLVVSPKFLHRLVTENPLNGTSYNVTNSQEWVRRLAEKISPKLVNAMKNVEYIKQVEILQSTEMDAQQFSSTVLSSIAEIIVKRLFTYYTYSV